MIYATKWFKGIGCLGGSSSQSMKVFCATLQCLTGGHVGLCEATIRVLNGVGLPSADVWIRTMEMGSLYRPYDGELFNVLTSTRVVAMLERLTPDELVQLLYTKFDDRVANGVLQCCVSRTSTGFRTSADVNAAFGSNGFVDFAINGDNFFWSFELLRAGISLVERIN
ncbi:Crinkler (CRN) [Phytophthora megakarya]|uniref:Crinkler (CRN) n=1 Tax=Phytophthora megakarya TaxID=4795 RepID=A0A225X0P2_9STRA|nr:Crinkler (CRN) [Phytophthora megakarya]